MKKVKVSLDVWKRLISKLKECMRANKELNRQIEEYNKKFTKDTNEQQ